MATKTNCTINGVDYYRITYDIGIDSNGKRIRKQFLGKSKKEAEAKKLAYMDNVRSGITNERKYLGATMKVWLFEVVKSGQIKRSSFARYEGIYSKYFKDSPIAPMSLSKIAPLDIQRYYNDLLKQGKSSNIINNANKLLKQFLNYCVDCGFMLNNPCDGKKIVIPKDENKKRIEDKRVPIFTTQEMEKILKQKEDTTIRFIALVSYSTGMRRGEILGLNESDFDYKTMEIHIRRTLITTYIYDDDGTKHKKTFLDDTKTYSSTRDIPLSKSLIPIIEKAINQKKLNTLAAINYNKDNSDLIFLTENGEYIEAGNIDKSWIYFLKRCGVEHKKFHALRHTYATLQFEANKPLITISKLLGHANIDVTASTYTHVMKKEKEKAIDTLSLLNGV